jgi:hypothetical protein
MPSQDEKNVGNHQNYIDKIKYSKIVIIYDKKRSIETNNT